MEGDFVWHVPDKMEIFINFHASMFFFFDSEELLEVGFLLF